MDKCEMCLVHWAEYFINLGEIGGVPYIPYVCEECAQILQPLED